MVAFRNTIERDYLYLLDYSRDVLAFEEQPLVIEYQYQGKTLYYTPSFRVRQAIREVLVACEEQFYAELGDIQIRLDAVKAFCVDKGYHFQVVTNQDLHTTRCIENIKLLTYYARHPISLGTRARIYHILSAAQDPMAVLQLATIIAPDNPLSIIADIYAMAFHHEIVIRLDDRLLTGDALVGLPVHQ